MDDLAIIIMEAIKVLRITGVTTARRGSFYNSDAASSFECTQLTDFLRYEGFTYIGGGNFSLAFTHPDEPEKVYKVGLKGSTDGWLTWASHCLQHQGEALIPTIHDVTLLDDELFIATLEKVQTCDTWSWQQSKLYDAMNTYLSMDFKKAYYLRWINNNLDEGPFARPLKKQRLWALDYHRALKQIAVIKHPLDNLWDLGMLCDTHEGNVGFNSKNHMILLDPIAWQEGPLDTTLFNIAKAA